jgi:hypothetical protein
MRGAETSCAPLEALEHGAIEHGFLGPLLIIQDLPLACRYPPLARGDLPPPKPRTRTRSR